MSAGKERGRHGALAGRGRDLRGGLEHRPLLRKDLRRYLFRDGTLRPTRVSVSLLMDGKELRRYLERPTKVFVSPLRGGTLLLVFESTET